MFYVAFDAASMQISGPVINSSAEWQLHTHDQFEVYMKWVSILNTQYFRLLELEQNSHKKDSKFTNTT